MTSTQDIVFLFHQLNRKLQQASGDPTSALGSLTLLQLQTLKIIQAQGKITMGDLAHTLQINPASATTLVDRLIRSEWLIRLSDPDDRRIVHLTLPSHKHKELHDIFKKKNRALQEIINHLSKEDQAVLFSLLEKMMTIDNQQKEEVCS